MSTINDLPFNQTPQQSDQVPLYSSSSGTTQRTSVNQFLASGLSNLPTVQPITGTNELWIDPLDGNTIKVAGPGGSTTNNLTQAVTQLISGTATDAGTLTGAEIVPMNRSAGLLQTTLTNIAQWVVQTYQGFTQAGTGAVAQTVAGSLAKTLYVSDYDTTAHAIAAGLNNRLIIPAGTTLTLNVPSVCATIQAAFAAIAGWVIQGTLIIQVADGTYTLASGINVNHPYGANIQLLGNTTTPDNCVLQGPNPPTFDALVCSNGNTLGMLDGFRFDLPAKAGSANNATAVLALNGAIIRCGSHIKTNNWYYGIGARVGSVIYARYANVNNAGDVGIWAFVGSSIDCEYATVTNSNDSANGLGFGFQAEYGSSLDCSNATASGCYIAGIAALSNSQVRALGATSSSNTGSGILAKDNAEVECHNAIANSNTRYGVEEIGAGRVLYSAITTSGNTLGTRAPVALLDNTNLGARLVSTSGSMRLDTTDTSSVYFNNANGLQAEVQDGGAGTRNRPVLRGGGTANGFQAQLTAAGSDTDIAIRLDTKGAGSLFLNTGSGPQFSVFDTPSVANRFSATGAIAGSAPRLQASGSDTNINLRYTPKGTGTHLFDGLQNFANDAAAAAGGIPVGGMYRNSSVLQIRVS